MESMSRCPSNVIPHRKFNCVEGYFGVRGTGKSTLALHDHARKGYYYIAHDVGFNIPDTWPKELGGGPTGIKRYSSVKDAENGIKRDANGIHCIDIDDAMEVVLFGTRLAEKSLEQGGGDKGVPVIIHIDEICMATEANPMRMGDELRKVLARSRHLHVGVIFTTQTPHMCHYLMISLSTKVHLLRMTEKRDYKRLNEGGVPLDIAERSAYLDDHKRITYVMGSYRPKKGTEKK
jgi:hypothetical protein